MSLNGLSAGVVLCSLFLILCTVLLSCANPARETPAGETMDRESAEDPRMDWWREARFGLFIHWGLYAVPAGEWKGETDHGEWILHTAKIPVEEYEELQARFNPVGFNADQWVRVAKGAGMKYIVITSKHHDGFCLFDSKHTDYDVMSTPFQRDILEELAAACRRHGLKICWYHSIMDWHHPDYLPRRPWEQRSAEGADMERYIAYMKNQLAELVSNYGEIGVLWFDGEWEHTWTHPRGKDLYDYVRGLQPGILINNRVDIGRQGMEGMSKSKKYAGDFGTPEQQIPPTGLPGVDWETCMTMNRHWGYNKNDHDWKSSKDLIRKLVDIASKGGNFLLNVGPTAAGRFPRPCLERLEAMGAWMKVNGESIYGTQASPFDTLEVGRCTVKPLPEDRTRLYLHIFHWPKDGKLRLTDLDSPAERAWLLADPGTEPLKLEKRSPGLMIHLPPEPPDQVDTVVALEIEGPPVVIRPPAMKAASPRFIESGTVDLATDVKGAEIRYTLDGTDPTAKSFLYAGPIRLTRSAVVKAQLYRDGRALSGIREAAYEKVVPRKAAGPPESGRDPNGLEWQRFKGAFDALPDFNALTPSASGITDRIHGELSEEPEHYALRFTGFVKVPERGLYRFYTDSDDGSALYIGDTLVVDNDGLHGATEAEGEIALEAGLHPLTVVFFQCEGGRLLEVSISGPELDKQPLPSSSLFH